MASFWEQHCDRFLTLKTFIMKSEVGKWLKQNPREQLQRTRSSDISGNTIMSDRSMMRKLTVTPQAMYDTPRTNTTRLIQPHRPTHEPPISPTHTFILLDMLQEQTAQIPLETANEGPEGQSGCSFIKFGSSGDCGFALNTMTRGSFSPAFSSNRNQDFNCNQNWEKKSIITSVALSRCDAAGHHATIWFLSIHLVLDTVM